MKLKLNENKVNSDSVNLIYKCEHIRVYESNDSVRVVTDHYINTFSKSSKELAKKLSESFTQCNASKKELSACLKALNLKEATVSDSSYDSIPEEKRAQEIQKWSFRINCYNRDTIMDDTNYDLSYLPENVREDLAYQIIHYPSSLIKLFNSEATEKHLDEIDEATLMHWGDLDKGIKADSKAIMYGRGTGHFGTGFYFVNKEHFGDMKYDYKPERPIYELDTSSYNLFEPRTNSQAYDLHTYLKIVNELKDDCFNPYDEYALRRELDDIMYYEDSNKLVKFIEKYEPEALKWDDQLKDDIKEERWLAVENYCKDIIDDLISRYDRADIASEKLAYILRKPKDEIYELIKKAHFNKNASDLTSTLVMKALGYEGIDVSRFMKDSEGLQGIDNFGYGSVIYDVKPGTYKRILEPRRSK